MISLANIYARVLLASVCLFVAGCSETILMSPDLKLTEHSDLKLLPPIALWVVDEESAERGTAYAGQFAAAILNAYPGSFELLEPSATAGEGRVRVTIRIRQLGAFFNRTKSSVLMRDPDQTRINGTIADWHEVVAASTRQTGPDISGSVYVLLPGNWSGITNIIVDVEDRRENHAAVFSLPLATERSRPNDFGYAAARLAAEDAWDNTVPSLTAFLDSAVRKVKSEQPR